MFTPHFHRNKSHFVFAFALAICVIGSAMPHRSRAAATSARPSAQTSAEALKGRAQDAYGKMNLVFEENRGQTDERVRFLSRAGNSTVFLTDDGAWFVLSGPPEEGERGPQRESKRSQYAVRMVVEGANPRASVSGERELEGKVNYFRGNDPSKWQTDVPTFGGVRYEGVYTGVDLVYYGNEARELEYDFRVRPWADPDQVSIRFEGAEELKVDKAGDLLIKTPAGELRQRRPLVYQEEGDTRREVASAYKLSGNGRVRFSLGEYDESRALVIDPALVYSTFLGGGNHDAAADIAVDSAGHAYIAGITMLYGFPTTPGAFDTTDNSDSDVFVTKLNASGSALIYSTYLGGRRNENDDADIAVDAANNAYVTGRTPSRDFPTTPGAFDTSYNDNSYEYDAFVTKLNPSGSALVYSTYLGGNNSSDQGGNIAVDATGNAYVTGYTISLRGTSDFPTTPGAFNTTDNGEQDVFVTKLNPSGSALIYSTFLGTTGAEFAFGLAVDSAGNAYVTGITYSADFPTTPGAFDSSHIAFGADGFVVKLNASGSGLIYSTYFSGCGEIAVDSDGNAYIAGAEGGSNGNAFVRKLNATGSALLYSRLLGGIGSDRAYSIAVDPAGNAYVAGLTTSPDFPTTPDAFDITYNGGNDVFLAKIDSTGLGLVYSTFLGGRYDEYSWLLIPNDLIGIALDPAGNIYVAGSTTSPDFPTTPGAFDTSYDDPSSNIFGNGDVFVAKINLLGLSSPPTIVTSPQAIQQGRSVSGAIIATVSDDFSTASCEVYVLPGGTATGITLSNISNNGGTVSAEIAATCAAMSGTVKLQVTDSDGLTDTKDMQVTVTPNDPPVITCPSDITAQAATTRPNERVRVDYPTPTVTDDCPGVGSPSCSPRSGSNFPVGVTTVTCSVQDASRNTSTCSFTVTVVSPAGCNITCPANITRSTDSNACSAVVTYAAPTTSGSCGTVTCNPPSSASFPKGTTTVTCSVAGGPSCSFTVTVNDTQQPTITCPQNQSAVSPNGGNVPVSYPTPTVSDNCSGLGTPVCTPASGSNFAVGVTTVNCSVQDAAGNSSNCSFTVTVTQGCAINCPANITTGTAQGQCSAAVNYPAPTTTGNCGTVSCSPASGSTFPKGTTTVTCSVSGGPSCTFSVTVNDTQNPAITCPANQTVTASGPTVVSYPAPQASDNCPGVTVSCSPASGSTFPLGTTTVNCTATDAASRTASCSFTVTVNQACSIVCPANITQGTDANACSAVVNYPAPTTTGNCGTVTCNPPSSASFPKGTTTVTCSVAGGPSCSFTVTVNDTQQPTITCPQNQSAVSPNGGNVPVSYPAPTVSDNCSGVGSPVCSPASGSNFPVGTTTVNCSVQDGGGNTANCSFTVTVTACTITCPANIVTDASPGQCSAQATYTTPTSNCGAVTCSPASGSTFPKGTTTVTCSVSGGPSCSFSVTVNDTQNPAISCPPNQSATSTGGCAVVSYPAPTATDNCAGVMVSCSPPSGSCFPPGVTTVICTAADASSNMAQCSFTVTVTVVPMVTFTVNRPGDDGDGVCDGTCTLRDAVIAANSSPDNDSIGFDPSLTTITLANEINIVNNGSLAIYGLGANLLTIDGGPGTNRIFYINSSVNITITDVTLTGGGGTGTYNSGRGGAIFVDSIFASFVTLDRVNLTGNTTATNQGDGGGIYFQSGNLVGALTIRNTTISNNTAGAFGNGGGVFITNSGSMTIVNSTISGNTATNGSGGGGLTIVGTSTTLRNVTITNNSSGANGGGGFRVVGTSVNLGSTIVAGNTGGPFPDITGPVTSAGYNLIGNSATGTAIAWQSTDILDRSPMLGALQNNGGPTPTHAFTTGSSPAIDKGNSFGSTTDQRGLPRPVDAPNIANAAGGDGSDIGAFEEQENFELPPALVVNLPGDDGDGNCNDGTCTLRDAILTANSRANDDAISFAPGLTHITLANEIVINSNGQSLTINGPGVDVLTIDGGPGQNRIFSISDSRSANVSITDVTLTGGNGVGATDNGHGGAILAKNGSLILDRVHVTGNSAQLDGGGVKFTGQATANSYHIRNSTFSSNTSGQLGGGFASIFCNITVVNSTFSGNTASNGGGFATNTTFATLVTLRNITVTGNTGTARGGGIYAAGTHNMGNSIVAGNTAPIRPEIESASGTFASAGYNLVGDSPGDAAATGNPIAWQSTDILDTPPLLGPLQNNGGPTPTHAFTTGSSPAIDKGNSFGSTTDQRGLPRPVDDPAIVNAAGGDGADIGAFEEQ